LVSPHRDKDVEGIAHLPIITAFAEDAVMEHPPEFGADLAVPKLPVLDIVPA
jgi:hypothetical protein